MTTSAKIACWRYSNYEDLNSSGYPGFSLKTAKVQILVNGVAGKEIRYRRGLRQGDPLPPLLFVLMAYGLNKMLPMSLKEEQ